MRRWIVSLFIACLAGCAPLPEPRSLAPPADVAYAWVTFDADAIRAGGAAGMADRARGRALTIDDPVRIASISKVVVALGAMRLVEQGRLDLDADVSEVLGFPVRNPSFPDTKITLRLLLSHRSGLTEEVNYAIPLGGRIRDTLADPKAHDSQHAPGTFFKYANLNYPVIASVMEAATGERFDRLMERLVLDPLGLDACFNWTTCSDAAVARAVVLYAPDGAVIRDDLGGRFPECPVVPAADGSCDLRSYRLGSNGALFSPQGGLRISARDLAVVGQLLLNGGSHRGQPFLSRSSIAAMTREAWRFDGSNGDTEKGFYCSYALGLQRLPVRVPGCSDDLSGTGRAMIGHAGDAYGLLSGLWIDPKRRVGIAFLATNNGEKPVSGRSAYRAVEEWLAAKLPR
jgi:CubicO group peptidase (beta-lactamase class C family)